MSGYICKLDEAVERKHVRYFNRYGIALAGDLYTAKIRIERRNIPPLWWERPTGA